MESPRDRQNLAHIIATCEDLKDTAVKADQPFIAMLLDMVIVQARRVSRGDGSADNLEN